MAQKFTFVRQLNDKPIHVFGPNGEENEVLLGLWEVEKTFNNETKITRFVSVGNTENGIFKDSNVRLYLPLKGHYDPTDEEIIDLFEGEPLFIHNLPKRDGGTYNANFLFDPWKDRSFTNRFGKRVSPSYTGDLIFAPSNIRKHKDHTEENHW